MAKLKTAYRPKMPEPIIPQPDHPVIAESITPQPSEPKFTAPVEAKEPEPKKDEAAERIRQQVEADRRAQELQRQWAQERQTQMAQQAPLTREQKLDLWRGQGMSESAAEFLKANPEMIDHNEAANIAAGLARQAGFEPGSDEHMRETKRIFDEGMAELKAQASKPAVTEPTPQFFQPPPPPRPRVPDKASIVSAPVSREPVGSRDELRLDPRSVKLSRDEVEAARISGVDLKTYAENKLKMMRAKEAGEIQ